MGCIHEDENGNEVMFTASNAAVVLGVSRRWLRYLVGRGTIRCVVAATGRGNQSVYAIPKSMLPVGYTGAIK